MTIHDTLTAASNRTRLRGFHDLHGRESLQVVLQGDRCYVGHLPGYLPSPFTVKLQGLCVHSHSRHRRLNSQSLNLFHIFPDCRQAASRHQRPQHRVQDHIEVLA